MRDDYIPQPRPRLCDEAAAQIVDFLHDFIADFESAYLVQIQRHRRKRDDAHGTDRTTTPAQPIDGDGAPF